MELMMLVGLLCVYIIPGATANGRGTVNEAQVWIVNIFLGWTFLGWVVALVMAFSPNLKERGPDGKKKVETRPHPNERLE